MPRSHIWLNGSQFSGVVGDLTQIQTTGGFDYGFIYLGLIIIILSLYLIPLFVYLIFTTIVNRTITARSLVQTIINHHMAITPPSNVSKQENHIYSAMFISSVIIKHDEVPIIHTVLFLLVVFFGIWLIYDLLSWTEKENDKDNYLIIAIIIS